MIRTTQPFYECATYYNKLRVAELTTNAVEFSFAPPGVTLKFEVVPTEELQSAYLITINFEQFRPNRHDIDVTFYGDFNGDASNTSFLGRVGHDFHEHKEKRRSTFLIPHSMFLNYASIIVKSEFRWLPAGSVPESRWGSAESIISVTSTFPCAPFDATLEHTYHVHKDVLVARSPVFAAMFGTPMLESRTNNVPLNTDGRVFSPKVIRAFIALMYDPTIGVDTPDISVDWVLNTVEASVKAGCKQLTVRPRDAFFGAALPVFIYENGAKTSSVTHGVDAIDVPLTLDLLALVHRYQIADRVDRIHRFLIRTLSAHNVTLYYEAALLYALPELATCCAHFVCTAMAQRVVKRGNKIQDFHADLLRVVQRSPELLRVSQTVEEVLQKRKERSWSDGNAPKAPATTTAVTTATTSATTLAATAPTAAPTAIVVDPTAGDGIS
jgi:hypothetical protein